VTGANIGFVLGHREFSFDLARGFRSRYGERRSVASANAEAPDKFVAEPGMPGLRV
jgi:hypothetical protein